MKEYDFRGVLGAVPDNHRENVQRTLNQLNQRDMRMGKASMRVLLIAAMVALLAGTALALTQRISALDMREGALPEAKEAVVDVPESASFESPLVRYRPIDALVDQGKLLIAIEATPIEPDKYLISNGWNEEVKFEEAERQGKKLIASEVSIKVNGELAVNINRREPIDENVQTITLECDLPNGVNAEDLTITAFGYDYEIISPQISHWDEADQHLDRPAVYGERYETQKDINIALVDLSGESHRFDGPYEMEYITIDWVELTRSPASLAMKVQFSYKEGLSEEIKDALEYMSISLMDPTGEKDVRTGEYVSSNWGSYPLGSELNNNWVIDESKIVAGSFIEESLWPAIADWPEKFQLIAYYQGFDQWSTPVEIFVNGR